MQRVPVVSFSSLVFEKINENLIVQEEVEAIKLIWRQDSTNSPGGMRFRVFLIFQPGLFSDDT